MNKLTFEHVFSKESKESLSKFIVASKTCESYRDIEHVKDEFKKWNPVMKNLAEIIELDDEIQSLNIEKPINPVDSVNDLDPIKNADHSEEYVAVVEHTVYYLAVDIQKEPLEKIQQIYRNLLPTLDFQKLIDIGNKILKSNSSDSMVECYCRELLFKKMTQTPMDELLNLLNGLYTKFTNLVTRELIHFLRINDELDIFTRNVFSKLSSNPDFSKLIFREYLQSFEGPITSRDILLFEYFEFKDIDSMKILIQILSLNAEKFKDDKSYGKLLIRIVDSLGSNIYLYKDKFDFIMSIHNSMWKTSIKKKICKYEKEIL